MCLWKQFIDSSLAPLFFARPHNTIGSFKWNNWKCRRLWFFISGTRFQISRVIWIFITSAWFIRFLNIFLSLLNYLNISWIKKSKLNLEGNVVTCKGVVSDQVLLSGEYISTEFKRCNPSEPPIANTRPRSSQTPSCCRWRFNGAISFHAFWNKLQIKSQHLTCHYETTHEP